MALIKCPECAQQVSDQAHACPHCGFGVADSLIQCPECEHRVSRASDDCPNCGFLLVGGDSPAVRDEAPESDLALDQVIEALVDVAQELAQIPTDDVTAREGLRKRQASLRARAGELRKAARQDHPDGLQTTRTAAGQQSGSAVLAERKDPTGDRIAPAAVPYTGGHRRRRSGLVTFWLWLLPILVVIPAAYPYLAGLEEIELPFMGTIDLADEAALLLATWGFFLWLSITASFLPTLVAFGRRARNRGTVAVINILLGVTGIGWIVALVLAFTSNVEPPIYVDKRGQGYAAPSVDPAKPNPQSGQSVLPSSDATASQQGCPSCGSRIPSGAEFCGSCGRPIPS